MVRLMLLERLLQTLPQLRNVGGVRAIPYMQVSSILLIHCVTVGLPLAMHFLFRDLRGLVLRSQKCGMQRELQVATLQVIAVVKGCHGHPAR